MTDRITYLTVTLLHDTRDDDVVDLIAAIEQFRGVAGVTKGTPVDINDTLVRHRLRQEIAREVYNLIVTGDTKGGL